MKKKGMIGTTSMLLFLFSCAPIVQTVRSFSWYKSKTLAPVPDISLSGKTILIDPGHGNIFSGSIGKHGTKEKDINLTVALHLKNLLQKQGATVYMTRDGDYTLWWKSPMTSRDDLGYRSHLRDSLMPDLFVSIHHNGSEDGSRITNNSKVFYAYGDPGASLDAAECINMEFSTMFGLKEGTVLPANYFVLRNTSVPTLLGEASYLSNPAMERRLQDSTALYWEATAYYRGIMKWFSLGVPKITSFTLDTSGRTITASITSDTPLDPALTDIYCDNIRLEGKICKGGYCAAMPFFPENKTYLFSCNAGSVSGNCALKAHFAAEIDRPVASLSTSVENAASGNLSRLRVTVLDRYGYPVKDGTPVIIDSRDTAVTDNGIALFYVPVSDTIRVAELRCCNYSVSATIRAENSGYKAIQGFVVSSDSNTALKSTLISYKNRFSSTDKSGFFSIVPSGDIDTVHALFTAAGFDSIICNLRADTVNVVKISPRLLGLLFNRRIVIDPEFGGVESGGINAQGIRACDITRKISSQIGGLLEEYGAQIRLAREDDNTVHVANRIICSEKFNSDLYIVVRSDSVSSDTYISCSPGSIPGKKLAQILSEQWSRLTGCAVSIKEEPSPVLMQTSCPAVILSLSPLRLNNPPNHHNFVIIAQTVLDGLIEYYKSP